MQCVYEAFPDDDDVTVLFVEALITSTPRRLWDMKTRLPATGTDTLGAMAICKNNDAAGKARHLGILHVNAKGPFQWKKAAIHRGPQ
ncbi:hypothetical protein J3459_012794 [Metarhizium acridum]|nr:hypothetical protein J3459_012794 [Metarhizium acridum]